jgi:hypothetical protein
VSALLVYAQSAVTAMALVAVRALAVGYSTSVEGVVSCRQLSLLTLWGLEAHSDQSSTLEASADGDRPAESHDRQTDRQTQKDGPTESHDKQETCATRRHQRQEITHEGEQKR